MERDANPRGRPRNKKPGDGIWGPEAVAYQHPHSISGSYLSLSTGKTRRFATSGMRYGMRVKATGLLR